MKRIFSKNALLTGIVSLCCWIALAQQNGDQLNIYKQGNVETIISKSEFDYAKIEDATLNMYKAGSTVYNSAVAEIDSITLKRLDTKTGKYVDFSATPDNNKWVAVQAAEKKAMPKGAQMINGFGAPGTEYTIVTQVSATLDEWMAQAGTLTSTLKAIVKNNETMPDGNQRAVVEYIRSESTDAQHNAGFYYRFQLENIPSGGQHYYIGTWLKKVAGNIAAGEVATDFRMTIYDKPGSTIAGLAEIFARAKDPLVKMNLKDEWTPLDYVLFVPKSAEGKFFEIRLYIPNGNEAVTMDMAAVEMYPVTVVNTGSILPGGDGSNPVTIYTEENYGGTSAGIELYKYYGAADATLSPVAIPIGANNTRSFKLNKGYMVTMTENADGTGYGRVWGAFDQDLYVPSLPAKLAGKVKFIRILPWENANKKGVGRATASVYNVNYMTMVDLQWYYNWGRNPNSAVIQGIPFVPMAWGRDALNATAYNQIRDVKNTCQLLAFNEPDGANTDQSAAMTVDEAIQLYPKLLATGMRMGSPAPVASGWNNWLKRFMKQAQEKNYRVDFICLHWYDKDNWDANKNRDFTDAQADACVQRLKTYLQNAYNLYGLPIWITEFNCNRNRSMSAQAKFYTRAVAMMEQLDFVERHAYMIPNVANNKYSNGDFLVGDVTPLTLSEMGVAFKNVTTTRAIKTPHYESSGNLDKNYNF